MHHWLTILAVTLYTLGTVAFAALFLDFVRAWRGLGRKDWLGGIMLAVCFFWFLINLLILFAVHSPDWSAQTLRIVQIVLTYSFPPLIATVIVSDKAQRGDFGGSCNSALDGRGCFRWKLVVGLFYVASLAMITWFFLTLYDIVPVSRRVFNATIGIGIGALFGLVSIFAIVGMIVARPKVETVRDRASRRSMLTLFILMLVIVGAIFWSYYTGVSLGELLQVLGSSMPLFFIFTDLYHANRFEFFDRFVKRGVALLLTLVMLAAWFAVVYPFVDIYREQRIGPILLAVTALPVVLALPWVFRKLGQWVDSYWLGRRLTTVDAVKNFLSNLQTATGERELVERAEAGLSTLFGAPTRIDLELREAEAPEFTSVQDVPIRSGDREIGAIRMGRRANQIPYFSEDIALLVSLGDVFSYMLENVRLQRKKREQEQRAQELAHQASLSELKALRAQINPHFLFNALNAIAGLIHKDPFRADATVEQLAEVFRYTLRGSEKEWARLEDEMEFVEAYLAVERARFGERLQIAIEADDGIRATRIPTMVIQTLVENAVKHGVATVRGEARVGIRVWRDDDRLIVEVTDNGPGFSDEATPPARTRAKGASFGLKSIRERFHGYFGDRATLTVERDEDRGVTTVRLTMPLDHGLGVEPGDSSAGVA